MRAEKGTPNENAFRTLLTGCVVAVLILVGLDPLYRLYDEHVRPQPWVSATMEITPARDGKPRILYDVDARIDVRGTWKAWVSNEQIGRLCDGGSGRGSYGGMNDAPRSWAWADWLGRDCYLPTIPFKVCVTYDVATPRGAKGLFGPFCSETYDPREVE